MADLNEVRLIGRLTRDPELRTIPTGQMVCSFGFATGRKYKGSDGNWQEETTFIDITCWGKLAEVVAKYSKKGRQLFIGGRLRFESWVDKQSGQKRNKLSVVADNVQFLDKKEDMTGAPMMEGDQSLTPSQWVASPAPQPSGMQWTPSNNAPVVPPSTPPTWDEPELGEPPF